MHQSKIEPLHALKDRAYTIVAVEFGYPLANGNCGHVGICRIEDASIPGVANANKRKRCRRALALLSPKADGALHFFFPADNMLPCTAKAFFSHATFNIPADFDISPGLLSVERATILAGHYPIEKSDEGYLVVF